MAQGTVFSIMEKNKTTMEKNMEKKKNIYIYITESLCCTPETKTAL